MTAYAAPVESGTPDNSKESADYDPSKEATPPIDKRGSVDQKRKDKQNVIWRITVMFLGLLILCAGIYFAIKGVNALFGKRTASARVSSYDIIRATTEPNYRQVPPQVQSNENMVRYGDSNFPYSGNTYQPVTLPPQSVYRDVTPPPRGYYGDVYTTPTYSPPQYSTYNYTTTPTYTYTSYPDTYTPPARCHDYLGDTYACVYPNLDQNYYYYPTQNQNSQPVARRCDNYGDSYVCVR